MSEGNGNGYATKESFFGGFTRRWKEVPSIFGTVVLGSLSEKEHQQFEKELSRAFKQKTEDNVRLLYMRWGLWKPDKSARLFSVEDIQRIAEADIDYAVTRNLTDEVTAHIGAKPEDIRELAGNS